MVILIQLWKFLRKIWIINVTDSIGTSVIESIGYFMKKVIFIFIILSTTIFASDIELDLELFSTGYLGHFFLDNEKEHISYVEVEAPTLYFNHTASNLSLFITPGQVHINSDDYNDYIYNPLLTGIRYNFLGAENLFLGPFTVASIDSRGQFNLVAGVKFHGGLSLLDRIPLLNSVMVRGIDLTVGWDVRNDSFIAKVSMDPVVAFLVFVYTWAEDLYFETEIYTD